MATVIPKTFELKNGEIITIRNPILDESEEILEHNISNMRTSKYLLTTAEEFTLTVQQEEQFIKQMLEDDGKLVLIADFKGEIVGFLDFHNGRRNRIKHQGEFGMSVRKDFRHQGVGRAMLEVLIDWAKDYPLIEKLNLQVISKNIPAIRLYESLGFEKEGIQRKAIKMEDGSYHDLYMMALFVNA